MNSMDRAIFGFVVVSAIVLGAFAANQAVAGGGKRIQFVPYPVYGQAPGPTLFDLLPRNPIPPEFD